MQKPHVIKGKEIDCKKALRKSQLPPSKKRQSGSRRGGGGWNDRSGYHGGGFEGNSTGILDTDVSQQLVGIEPFGKSVVTEPEGL